MKRLILLFFIIGLSSLVYVAGETTYGLHMVLNMTSRLLPGNFSYQTADGKLFSKFSINKFAYQNEQSKVSFSELFFKWNSHALLHGIFSIRDLEIKDLTVNLSSKKSTTQNNNSNSYKFLKNIVAHEINLQNFTILQNNTPLIHFASLHLEKVNHEVIFYSKTLQGSLNGYINLSWKPYFTWNANIKGSELNPGEIAPDWKGNINFNLVTEGKLKPQATTVQVNLRDLIGNLRNQPLKGTIMAVYHNDSLNISNTSLHYGNADITVDGTLADSWNINWKVNLPNLSLIIPDTNGKLEATGNIVGKRNEPIITSTLLASQLQYLNNEIKTIKATADINVLPGKNSVVDVKAEGTKIYDYHFHKINLQAKGKYSFSANKMIANVGLDVANIHYVDTTLIIPRDISSTNYSNKNLSLQLSLNFPDLASLKDYFPKEIANPSGTLKGLININGTLFQPRIAGNISLTNGKITIPALNIDLQNINLAINGRENKKILYSGSAESKNKLTIKGDTDLLHDGFPTSLTLQGENVLVANTAEYKIIASPNITLRYINGNLALAGDIIIPEATIAPKDFSNTVTLPDEVVFVNTKRVNAESSSYYLPTMHINLKLGNAILVKYQNLQTQLVGSLTIQSEENRYATATGELVARNGKYQAYGKSLTIQDGKLIYTGNLLTNPGLNIKATRSIDTVSTDNAAAIPEKQKITVGVKITGDLNKPHIELFSDPSNLSKSNILSYLVLGIPETQATGDTKKALFSALSVLSMGNGDSSKLPTMTNKIQKSLGLNELDIKSVQYFDPDPKNGGVKGADSIVLGKKIANKLFVEYSVGLTSPVSILSLRYQLNKHWAIQSETSSLDTGADILYSIERD